jgi:hypothetical protein
MDNTGITRKVEELIAQQIHTFKQNAAMSDHELKEYLQRSQQIWNLCRRLNQGSSQTWVANQPA